MKDELERTWKEAVVAFIGSKHLPNTDLERHIWTSLFSGEDVQFLDANPARSVDSHVVYLWVL
jgi:hypothetical protein